MCPRAASFPIVLSLAMSACSEPPPVTCGAARYYQVDRIEIPQRSGDGSRLGFDLDGDGNVDNALGTLVSVVRAANPDIGDLDLLASARLTSGDAIWLVGVSDCDDGSARVEVRQGEDPDGDGVPSLVRGAAPLASTSDGSSVIDARGGEADVPLTLLADPLGTFTPIAWPRTALAHVHLEADATGLAGAIGFALPMPTSAAELVAPLAAYLTGELRAGTSPYAEAHDDDHDGVVTPEELLADDNVHLLTSPDVGRGLSAGVGIHATPVELAP